MYYYTAVAQNSPTVSPAVAGLRSSFGTYHDICPNAAGASVALWGCCICVLPVLSDEGFIAAIYL